MCVFEKYFLISSQVFNVTNKRYTSKNNKNTCNYFYIRNLKKISNDSNKITDKLPINFKWIGLIKLILPNSKIIFSVSTHERTKYQDYVTLLDELKKAKATKISIANK